MSNLISELSNTHLLELFFKKTKVNLKIKKLLLISLYMFKHDIDLNLYTICLNKNTFETHF